MASSPSGGRERQASNAAGGPSSNLLPPPALPLHLQGKNITVESIFYEQKMPLGTPCLVQDSAKGTVRYWGPVPELGEGDWVGVELENPVGDTDGSYAGKFYFAAQPNHAIFVSPSIISPYDESMTPAVIIDDLKKRLQAKELERIRQLKANADSWNKLDAHQEQMLLRRALMLENIFGTSTRRVNVDQMEPIELEEGYDGPHLSFPLQPDQVMALLEHFKRGEPLHIKYALELLAHSRKLFAAEPTLQDIVIPEGHRLTLVGDLHGQLQDLFTIFTLNGLPSEESEYIFNGDLVDRGAYGAEVLFTILAFKCLFPRQVRVNRGNHECRQQNRLMGFEEEVLRKYPGPNGRVLLAACQKVFDCMPLCALIQEKIFVVHGGLFSREGVAIEHIRGISRKREPPVHSDVFEDRLYEEMLWSDPRTGLLGKQLSSRGAGIEFGQDVTFDFLRTNQLALIVRSHECVNEGYDLIHNGRLMTLFSASRYCGLQANKGAFLSMRSDLQPEIQQYYAHPMKDSHWEKPTAPVSQEQEEIMARVLEEDMIKMIVVSLLDNKPSLYYYYTQVDKERTGLIAPEDWASGLRTVLQLDLPFLSLLPRIAEADPATGLVSYPRFLDRYRVEVVSPDGSSGAWQEAVIDAICEKLFLALQRVAQAGGQQQQSGDTPRTPKTTSTSSSVKDAFSLFDVDQDGRIEYEEFVALLKTMDVGLSEAQVYELMRGMDKNKDSVIDLEEFTSRFGIIFTGYVDRENEGIIEGLSAADSKMLMKIGERIVKSRRQLEKVYAEIAGGGEDGAGDGEISYEQFRAFVHRLGLGPKTNDDQLRRLAEHLDVDRNGYINYHEFAHAFKVADLRELHSRRQTRDRGPTRSSIVSAASSAAAASSSSFVQLPPEEAGEEEAGEEADGGSGGWTDRIIQQMSNFLFQYRLELASMFRAFDVNNDGTISCQEFKDGFVKLNRVFSMALTEEQIELIMRAVDRNGDGQISYLEFTRAFKLVDTKRGSDILDCSSSTSSGYSASSPRPSDASPVVPAATAAGAGDKG